MSQNPKLGGSFYLDKERTWSLNAVGTFEASNSNPLLNPGNYLTLDWGIFKQLDENWKIGLTGYDTRQLTPISGLPRGLLSNFTNSADAIGGEIGVTIPEAHYLSITAKFSHEYNSFGRFGGNVGSLTFSIPLEMDIPRLRPNPRRPLPLLSRKHPRKRRPKLLQRTPKRGTKQTDLDDWFAHPNQP